MKIIYFNIIFKKYQKINETMKIWNPLNLIHLHLIKNEHSWDIFTLIYTIIRIYSMSYFSLKTLQSIGGYNSIRFLFWFSNDVGRLQCSFPNIIGHIVHMGTDSRRCCFGLCFPQQPGNVHAPVSLLFPF